MSSGSYFTLYKRAPSQDLEKIGVNIGEVHKKYMDEHKDDFCQDTKNDDFVHPRFYDSDELLKTITYVTGMDWIKELVPTFDCFDSFKMISYNKMLTINFNSIFCELRNHYHETEGMTSYDPRYNYHVINEKEATLMVQAIDYLLLGKYDWDVQKLFNNEFIEMFGYMVPQYAEKKYRERFPDDKDYSVSDEEDCTYILIRIKTILDAYLLGISEYHSKPGDYLLVYHVWG